MNATTAATTGMVATIVFALGVGGCNEGEPETGEAVTTATSALSASSIPGHPNHAMPHRGWHCSGRPPAPDCSGAGDGGLCDCGAWRPPLIDNLEDGNTSFGPTNGGAWFAFNDGTGAQIPTTAEGLVIDSPLRGNKFAAHSSGEGFTVWGAGFGVALGCAYDVSRYQAVRFKAKAGGVRHFFVEFPTLAVLPVEFGGQCTVNCNDFHRASVFLADDAWYECTVAFADIAQAGWGAPAALDLGAMTGIQYNFGSPDVPYDLTVDDLEFVKSARGGTSCVRVSAPRCGK